MNMSLSIHDVTVQGQPVDSVYVLDDCNPLLADPIALRRQMLENGYIYLPNYLGRENISACRRLFIDAMEKAGALLPGTDPMDGIIRPGAAPGFAGGRLEQLFPNWQVLHDVLYAGPMIDFFTNFFGTDVRHYDYTWTRQMNPGPATPIHADVVYMGRGTHELYTAWTPMGDNGYDLGGLILLEGSNNHVGLAKSYFQRDVDVYCENKPDARGWGKVATNGGALLGSANQLRKSLDGERWLTADFKMGDVVIFSCYTVHGGTDNRSNKVRLSTDTRYQRADAPADERWIGASPSAHGVSSKRGLIC